MNIHKKVSKIYTSSCVNLDNSEQVKDQIKTIMVVTAQDRPGLLHQVARALIECKTHLVSAKISTFGERVEDIFYITDLDGQPINN